MHLLRITVNQTELASKIMTINCLYYYIALYLITIFKFLNIKKWVVVNQKIAYFYTK